MATNNNVTITYKLNESSTPIEIKGFEPGSVIAIDNLKADILQSYRYVYQSINYEYIRSTELINALECINNMCNLHVGLITDSQYKLLSGEEKTKVLNYFQNNIIIIYSTVQKSEGEIIKSILDNLLIIENDINTLLNKGVSDGNQETKK